jgi:hypothetical protein
LSRINVVARASSVSGISSPSAFREVNDQFENNSTRAYFQRMRERSCCSIEMPGVGRRWSYGGLEEREKFGLWRPYRILSPAWPYSSAAMKSTIFDSDCICLTILPTSSFGSLVSESRTR